MYLPFVTQRFRRLSVPGAFLIALLQRTPVVRVAEVAESIVIDSPIGNVLRSALTAVASLGAIHSLAGATQWSLNPNTTSISGTVGTPIQSFAFTVIGAPSSPPGSFRIVNLPPGLIVSPTPNSSGVINAASGGISGTPTTAGTFQVQITAYEFPNGPAQPGQDSFGPITITYTITGGTPTAPVITTQPQSQTVIAGSTVTFTAAATGSPFPTFQWQKNGINISGATNTTLTLSSVQTSDSGTYTFIATNSAGSKPSNDAVLQVSAGAVPIFTQQPTSQAVATGSSVAFNAAASGAISYKWQRNGVDVPGATGPILLINNSTSANAGTYVAIATNSAGSTPSNSASLTVSNTSAADTGRLSNLSVRTFSGTSDQVLIVGFGVGGSGTSGSKPLLIRVTGPALAGFGVGGTMTDPTLTVQPLNSTNVVAANDDWSGNSNVASTSTAVGAFGLVDPSSKDAATVTSLSAGAYTTLAAGKNNSTGIVLTEIYDATSSNSITASTPRLINVSARANSGSGDSILIAGFVVAGSTAKTLLIRATGPTLAGFGVSGTMADPKIELSVLNGPKLYENDNWGGSPVITATGRSVGAFDITDSNSRDAVLLVTLAPGGYTVKVSGADGGTGIALVEVYDVP